uniref:Natural cytotoxicity triggering receptor 3 n=1 Tax=Erpetoichthys calabaricus TaxID=27687 RepID=A0A8C4RSV6_ERPCA
MILSLEFHNNKQIHNEFPFIYFLLDVCYVLINVLTGILAKLHVSQDREVRADDGDDAILRCYFTCQHDVTLGSFKWYKDRVGGREVSEKSFHNRLDRTGTQTFLNKKDASITIRRVSFQDAGVYFCEVDLAGVGKANGSGTELKINEGWCHLQHIYLCRGCSCLTSKHGENMQTPHREDPGSEPGSPNCEAAALPLRRPDTISVFSKSISCYLVVKEQLLL